MEFEFTIREIMRMIKPSWDKTFKKVFQMPGKMKQKCFFCGAIKYSQVDNKRKISWDDIDIFKSEN